MLKFLSGKSPGHYLSWLSHKKKFDVITETTKVYFRNLTDQEIDHYIEEASPLDKAGGYGIQVGF